MDRDSATQQVIDQLKQLYKSKLLPLEQTFLFNRLCSPFMTDAEFEAKPQVLLIGQYSTGKTTFIRYLLGSDFPGQRIGPEPTTDRFIAVLHGEDEHLVPGNALCVSPDLPYRGLERFGTSFLNKFEGSQLPNKVLENITLIDSPGILAGKKQSDDRGYDFMKVCQWFAERCDLILLLFDAHKLDLSDEFRDVIEKLKGHEDKIRCVLNKADQIDRQRLMRVYGALMWGMGKVLKTPEVLRVYIGSFWEQPLMYEALSTLFEREENDLMRDLRDLPRNSAVRKINELVKRARLAKVNAHIVSHLGRQMPTFTGKAKKQEQLLRDLPAVFRTVMKTEALSPGDFPDLPEFRSKIAESDFSRFPKLNKKHLDGLEEMLTVDIPRLMEQLPRQLFDRSQELPIEERIPSGPAHSPHDPVRRAEQTPAAQPPAPPKANPFAKRASNPFAKSSPPAPWPVNERKAEFDAMFAQHDPVDGKLDGEAAKGALVATQLDMDNLFAVWELSDHDGDGMLDDEEFALAMYLCDMVQNGEELPSALPAELIPPKQRQVA